MKYTEILKKTGDTGLKIENTISITALLLIAILPIIEVIARLLNQPGIRSSSDYIQHLVIWITFAGGMITSREGRHLSLSIGVDLIREPYKSWIQATTAMVATAVTSTLALTSYTWITDAFVATHKIGIFPVKTALIIMPAGFLFMSLRFIMLAPKGYVFKSIATSGILIAFLISKTPFEYTSLTVWPCIIILIVTAFLGTPIFVVLGGIASILFFNESGDIRVISNEAYEMLTGDIIPAIPLFTTAGFILSESKAGERLVHFFRAILGWLPGGLAIMAILVCAFFTTFTGASGVTILALGGLLSFVLVESKYKKKFSTGLLTASGSIGLLFPPSLPIILYGVVAHINIKKMFVGGLLPGMLMIMTLAIIGIISAKRNKVECIKFSWKEAVRTFKSSILEIALPIIILYCFFTGKTTLVQTGAVAVIYTLITQIFIHKDIAIKDFHKMFLKCIPMIGGVLVIMAVARGLSYFIIDAEIPMQLAEWCKAHIHSKYVFLILLNIALLITGCFMDIFSAIIVVVPLIIPLGELYGVHPVHLGIIFLANLELGYLTPPVGLNLFLASFRFETPLVKIYKYVMPFLIVLLVSVLLITYIPWLTTALLDVIKF